MGSCSIHKACLESKVQVCEVHLSSSDRIHTNSVYSFRVSAPTVDMVDTDHTLSFSTQYPLYNVYNVQFVHIVHTLHTV